jgi:MerR family transcriptional regulator, thiopeptide resistance regulator
MTVSGCCLREVVPRVATRLYCHDDLGRLERILVLRYLGLTLREIAGMLAPGEVGQPESLPTTLVRQSAVLRKRRDDLNRVLHAIEHVQVRVENSAEPDWLLYQIILKEIQMQEPQNWIDTYYSPEGLIAIRERRASWTPELQAGYHAKWQGLFADVQSALERGVAPASEEAKALATRWVALQEAFTQGKPEVVDGLRRLYSDAENWPDDQRAKRLRSGMPKPEHIAFIRAVTNQQ